MTFFNLFKSLCASFYAMVFACIFSFSSINSFAHFGPRGPFGGNVSCFTSFNGIVYVGTQNGGVFESTTSDIISWRARPVGLKSGKITALVHTGNYLIAGTADSGIFIFNGFIGSDRYWNRINKGLGSLRIKSLVAIDSITIIAGTEGNGLFKTIDKGATWNAINSSALNNTIVTSLANSGHRLFALSLNKGVFVSDDNGNTWSDFNDANTLNIPNSTLMSYNGQTEEILVKNNNGMYVVGSVNSISSVPAFVSVQANIPMGYDIRNMVNIGTDWFLSSDFGVYTADSNLLAWKAINTGLPNNDIASIIVSDSNLVLGIRNSGIYKSRLGTYSWTEMNASFNNIATKSMLTSGDSLVIAVTEQGVHISKNLLPDYVISNNGLTDFKNINDIIIGNGKLYAATTNGGVFMSPDLGANWSAINTGLGTMNISKLFYGNNELYLIDFTGNIFKTSTAAYNWSSAQGGLPASTVPTSIIYYDGRLILGTSGNGVFIKPQKENAWVAANNGLSNMKVTSVAASGNKIYAGTAGSGVFISDLNNVNWKTTSPTTISHTVTMNLDGNYIQAMGTFSGYVYASYKGGLLTTSDSGKTWIAGGNQFNLPSYTDVSKITFVTSRVYVSTENNGLYSNALSELVALPDFLLVSKDEFAPTTFSDSVTSISVSSNLNWVVSSSDPWIKTSILSGSRDGDFDIILDNSDYGNLRTGTVTVTAGSVIKTIKIQQNGNAGIKKDNNLNASFNVYPNPSDGNVSLDFNSGITVQKISVSDLAGKMLEERNFDGQELNFHYASGIYLLNVYTDKGMATKKLIIK